MGEPEWLDVVEGVVVRLDGVYQLRMLAIRVLLVTVCTHNRELVMGTQHQLYLSPIVGLVGEEQHLMRR